jgi:hypothetical protein
MNFNIIRINFIISGTLKQIEALEIRIEPLIKDCPTFSSRTIPIMAEHL